MIQYKYLAGAYSEQGNYRKKNEDSLLFRIAKSEAGDIVMAVLCDGMGGHQKGELASKTLAEGFAEWFENQLPFLTYDLSMEIISEQWKKIIQRENERIYQYGRENEIELGTTLTALFMAEGNFLIAHVGDCRAYRIDNRLRQLTTDHALPERNVLLQCIGIGRQCEPEIFSGRVRKGEIYLLCSDGFYQKVQPEMQEKLSSNQIVNEKGIRKHLKSLSSTARKRGEKDNISAVLVKVVER